MLDKLWKDAELTAETETPCWEIYHESSKTGHYDKSLTNEQVLEVMDNLYDSFPYKNFPSIPLPDSFATIERSFAEAAGRFSEGGYGIALRILEIVRSKAVSPLRLASVTGQIQNIRIALMYFNKAASESDPSEDLPDDYKASLYQSKAWGLVMSNKPFEAEKYFELARKYLTETAFQRLYLYLLNISALNKVRIGDMDTAFEFEKRIENKLSELPKMDWHILYINSINQARLYKKIKDYELSEAYYLKAFAINHHLKSESDLLYTNLCLAQLENLRENYKSAFIFWLRTCIHWLSSEVPESLAPRVAQSVLFEPLSSKGTNVEKISEKLSQYLRQAADKISLNIGDKSNDSKIIFSRIERAAHLPEAAFGTTGLGLFVSSETEQTVYGGEKYDALKKLVYDILCVLLPDIENYKTIYTDTQFGDELPVSSKELINSCIRHKVSKIMFGTKKFVITGAEQFRLLMSCKIKICSAVSSIIRNGDAMKIRYKRYGNGIILTDSEKNILEFLDDQSTVGNICESFENKQTILRTLREMEEKRLISVYL